MKAVQPKAVNDRLIEDLRVLQVVEVSFQCQSVEKPVSVHESEISRQDNYS